MGHTSDLMMIFKGGSRISSQVGPTTSPRLESRWVGVDIVYIYFKNDYYSIYIYVFYLLSLWYSRADPGFQVRWAQRPLPDWKVGGWVWILFTYISKTIIIVYIYMYFKVSGSYFRLDDDIQGRIQDFKSGGPNDLSQIGKSVGGCGYCLHIFQKRLL